jgi:hypothetical protein
MAMRNFWDKDKEHVQKLVEEAIAMKEDRERYDEKIKEIRKEGKGIFDFQIFKKRFRFGCVR